MFMNQNQILAEVKKAIDFLGDGTYNESAFYSHILAIIRDNANSEEADIHRNNLERLIFKINELRENQRLYWGGHKSKLGVCKAQESELDKKIHFLLTTKGYSIERFKVTTEQKNLFK